MSKVSTINVQSAQEMHSVIQSYVVCGYAMVSQQPGSVTLVKRKQLSVVMLLIGLLLFILPMFIYLIVYMLKKDDFVEVRMVDVSATLPSMPVQASPPPQPWRDQLPK